MKLLVLFGVLFVFGSSLAQDPWAPQYDYEVKAGGPEEDDKGSSKSYQQLDTDIFCLFHLVFQISFLF